MILLDGFQLPGEVQALKKCILFGLENFFSEILAKVSLISSSCHGKDSCRFAII